MSRLLDPKEIQEKVESTGYKVLRPYRNAKEKIQLMCPEGHIYETLWTNHRKGHRCPFCKRLRLKSEDVKAAMEKAGYTVTGDYINSKKASLLVTCRNGHSRNLSWAAFSRGGNCPFCIGAIVTQEQVDQLFKEKGFKLLSKYRKAHAKLSFICDKGHKCAISWTQAQSKGLRCPDCSTSGFQDGKPATLYYLKFLVEGASFYKIGITNRTIEARFSRECRPYQILYQKTYLFGSMAREEEKRILAKYARYLYKGEPVLNDGNSELFIKDVLRLDKSFPDVAINLNYSHV